MSVRHAFAKIITAAVRTSRHDKESTAYLARYFQQLLCRLNGQLSALPSRATSPTPLDGAPMAARVGGGSKAKVGPDATTRGGIGSTNAGDRSKTTSNVESSAASTSGSSNTTTTIGPGVHPPSHVEPRAPSIFDHPAGAGMMFDQHGYALPSQSEHYAHQSQAHQQHLSLQPRHHQPSHHQSQQTHQSQQQPATFPPDPLVDQPMADLPGMYTTTTMNGEGVLGTGAGGGEFGMFPPTLGDDIYWLTAWPALSGLWQDGTAGHLAPQ